MADDQNVADQVYIGERLRAARTDAGLSLDGVETATCGRYRASVVGMYERAERAVSAHRLAGLARFYKVDVATLLPPATDTEAFLDRLTLARSEVTAALASIPEGASAFAPNLLRRVEFLLSRLLGGAGADIGVDDETLEEALA